MKWLCKLFGHRWKLCAVGFPYNAAWWVRCARCDRRTVTVSGLPFPPRTYAERWPWIHPSDRTQAFFHEGYRVDPGECCDSCRAHMAFGVLTNEELGLTEAIPEGTT